MDLWKDSGNGTGWFAVKFDDGAVERACVFGDIIEAAGYWCGIYANLYWWEMILKDGLERFTKWVAQYYSKCEYTGANLDIWQYSRKGRIDGIGGNVDMNECYRDLPGEILGGKTVTQAAAKKTVDEMAAEVLDGKWGNGGEREQRLTAAGYDYEAVQARVNAIVAEKQSKSLDAVVTAVIRGDYGNGSARDKKLTAAGYDPKEVQALVNKRLGA